MINNKVLQGFELSTKLVLNYINLLNRLNGGGKNCTKGLKSTSKVNYDG